MLLEDDADRGGICLSDDEHTNRMGGRAVGGKRPQRRTAQPGAATPD